MKPTSPPPSSRLLRAAAAETTELKRHHAALAQRRQRMLSELAELEAALAETNERLVLIERITGPSASPADDGAQRSNAIEGPPAGGSAEPQSEGIELRGPAIRHAAVRVLLEDPQQRDALHYKEWFGLLMEAGYSVAGKDPQAVFLTQIGRSSVVRRSTQSGVYELDRTSVDRLRGELDQLQAELGLLTTSRSGETSDLRAIRQQRTALTLEISKVEKALEEARELLGPPPRGMAATA